MQNHPETCFFLSMSRIWSNMEKLSPWFHVDTEKLCAEITFFKKIFYNKSCEFALNWMFDLFSLNLGDDTGVVLTDWPKPPEGSHTSVSSQWRCFPTENIKNAL